MNVLLDECIPKGLLRHLKGHHFVHALDLGWSGKKNGELLKAMSEAGYEVLLTVDRNLSYQQNIKESAVIVIVMAGKGNRLADIIPLVPSALEVIPKLKPGDVVEIGPPQC